VKPKIWKKLTDAQDNFPMWVAAIAPFAPRAIGGHNWSRPRKILRLENRGGEAIGWDLGIGRSGVGQRRRSLNKNLIVFGPPLGVRVDD
jgi:hypothetical protein